MSELLNPNTLPLQGSRLIEASAGTGKTWTIAALFVRLVLGHGAPGQGLGRALLPGEILVMTFTKAATRELSDRIRHRLVEAAACFRGTLEEPADGFLISLLQDYPEGPPRQQAAWRLAMAAEGMDDAAVHTIDAWCQRMLREHAFDSGCLFDEELQANEAALVAEAVHDHWRQQVYALDGDALDTVLALWPDVGALAQDLRALLGKPLPADAGQGSLAEAIVQGRQQRADALAALKAGWSARADQMLDALLPVWGDKKHPGRSLLPRQGDATRWTQALKDWALDPSQDPLEVKTGATRLSGAAIEAALGVPAPDCFAAFDRLLADLAQLPVLEHRLRLHAAARVNARVQQLKAQAGTFGFADMLDRLDRALDESVHGARAQQLRRRILDQYPAALIDEFQDTSPVQLSIFDRLYRIADNEASRVLLLIGDPKQAIYGFRGADIYSYLVARQATRGRHHVLGTNHRSTKPLVDAVNRLFKAAEDRPGDGAFQFGAGSASALPFVEVQAQGRAQRLVSSAGKVPAITALADPDWRNAADSRELFAALCAERIVGLLNDPGAGFVQDGQAFVRLRPADIAVLVRSGTEAQVVRQAMSRRGLASVYLSDKDTVFQTDEAADLLRLLQAVAEPRKPRLARAALATALLGLSLEELLALSTDDERFDRQCELLRQLQLTWKHQGVLVMLRRALHAFGLPARLLRAGDPAPDLDHHPTVPGERRLTNVLHLAELLQAASDQVEGEQALIRWLAQQIEDGDAGLASGDELVLRLESDADLVKVVTVHKSKGLEYPLVFLPFAAHFREVDSDRNAVLLLPASEGRSELVLSPDKAQVARAERERQREYLRLLYVALTRARHALWLGVSGLRVGVGKQCIWHRSAIGYLVSGPDPQAADQRVAHLQALAQAGAQLAVEMLPVDPDAQVLPLPPVTRVLVREAPPVLAAPPVYRASFERNWSISSYSALVRDAARGPAASGQVASHAMRDDEPDEPAADQPAPRVPVDQPWHRFPRGAFAGNFLHDQLEWLAAEGFALDRSPALQQALLRRCERQGWGHRADEVLAWLRQLCVTPLPPVGVPLSGLDTVTPEMEFWFPSDGLQASRVDHLCRQHVLPGRDRPALPEKVLNGMLMGFADLVFEHDGRYWVLDHKSNSLGPRDSDYTVEAMQAAMLDHRYDVQAALYLLALHRLLRLRLGSAYVPAQHLGGAVYLFLRGLHSASAGCFTVTATPALLDALDRLQQPGSAAGLQSTRGEAA